MKITPIIMGRAGSSRFPNKLFAHINGRPAIEHVIHRVSHACSLGRPVVSTTAAPENRALETITRGHDVILDYGPDGDAMAQFYHAAQASPADAYMRITADCVAIDPWILDEMARRFAQGDLDFITNSGPVMPRVIPRGIDCEIVTADALRRGVAKETDPFARQHLTRHFYFGDYRWIRYAPLNRCLHCPDVRLVLDTWLDWIILDRLFAHFGQRLFSIGEAIRWVEDRPEIHVMMEDLDGPSRELEQSGGIWLDGEKAETAHCGAQRNIASIGAAPRQDV